MEWRCFLNQKICCYVRNPWKLIKEIIGGSAKNTLYVLLLPPLLLGTCTIKPKFTCEFKQQEVPACWGIAKHKTGRNQNKNQLVNI